MSTFNDELAVLISDELVHAQRDEKRAANIVEMVSRSLGLSIAVLTRGDKGKIDQMVTGVEVYIHETAIEKLHQLEAISSARGK